MKHEENWQLLIIIMIFSSEIILSLIVQMVIFNYVLALELLYCCYYLYSQKLMIFYTCNFPDQGNGSLFWYIICHILKGMFGSKIEYPSLMLTQKH